ncbi:hypothetical protein ACQ4PT_038238 [Festuca glaucescens]
MESTSRVVLSDSDLSSAESSAREGSSALAADLVADGETQAEWMVAKGSRQRRRRLQRSARQLPTPRPPPHRRLPPGMAGKCYNCLGDECIAAQCTNMVRCVLCGEEGHISHGCKRPRSPSEVGSAPRLPLGRPQSPTWLPPPPPGPPPPGAARLEGALPSPPPGPPLAGAVRLDRSWSRVVREGSEESVRGPAFSVPFVPQPVQVVPATAREAPAPPATPAVTACFLEYSEEMDNMEEQFRRAVVVTITGTRPVVDLADAALALHREFNVGPESMSIRAFAPEDFLVLCHDVRLRDRMVRQGRVSASWFSLSLRGWLRQAQATAVQLPYLVPLELLGVPAHAWHRRTAKVLLEGTGFVVDVAAPTARRHGMYKFRIWVRTDSPERILAGMHLFIEEPPLLSRGGGRHRGPPVRRRAKMLRYFIRIRRVREAGEALVSDSPPPPSPLAPPPPPPSGGPASRARPGIGRTTQGAGQASEAT